MATLKEIEELTGKYADARGILCQRVDALERKLYDAKERYLPAIKTALSMTKEVEARLRAAIEESAAIFERPRTQVFHGVKVGYMKSKGSIEWEDADTVVRLIFRHFGDRADVLTRTTVVPNRQTLAELPAADLKKLGVSVTNDADAVVIKPVDGEVERIVNALLKDESGKEAA